MGRNYARLFTLIKLSPLYLIAGFFLYVLFFMEKDFDYLEVGRERLAAGDYREALHYLSMAEEGNIYRGTRMLEVLQLRADTLNHLKGYRRALADLDKLIQLRPDSERARTARTLKGEILYNQEKFKEALKVFEALLDETEEEEVAERTEYRSKTAAAAYGIAIALLVDTQKALVRSLNDPSQEIDGINRYVTNLDQDYDRPWLNALLLESLSKSAVDRYIGMADEARKQFRYAFDTLKDYHKGSSFNALSSDFLAHILYRAGRYLPAMIECQLALKEPLHPDHQRNFRQIMADIYLDLDRFAPAARIFKTIRGPRNAPSPRLDPAEKRLVERNLLLSLLKNGRYDETIVESKAILKKDEEELVAKYCLAAAYLMTENIREAVPLLSDIVEVIRSGWTPKYLVDAKARKKALQLLYTAFMNLGSYSKALDVLSFAIQLYPNDFEFRRRRAKLLDNYLKNTSEACEDYLYVLEHGTRDGEVFADWQRTSETRFITMTGFTFKDRARRLIDMFERKERMVGDDVARFSELSIAASFTEAVGEPLLKRALGKEFIARGRREQGKSIFRMLTREFPEVLQFAYDLGCLYFAEGESEPALREFKRILDRDLFDFESIVKTVDCYRDLDDFIGEGRMVRSILQSGNRDYHQWMLARLKFERGKHDDFFRMYDAIVRLPVKLETDLDLLAARCWIDRKRFGKAGLVLEPILETDPGSIEALMVKAMLLASEPAPEPEPAVEDVPEVPLEKKEGPPDTGEEDVEETREDDRDGAANEGGEGQKEAEEGSAGEEAFLSEDKEGLSEDEEEGLPEAKTEVDRLVDTLRSMGNYLNKKDVEELCAFFIEKDRPELVVRLLLGIETLFPLTKATFRHLAEARYQLGQPGQAATLLLYEAGDPEDLRQVFAMGILSGKATEVCLEIERRATGSVEDGEYFLRAAAAMSLETFVRDAKGYLDLASGYSDFGPYSEEEKEGIDFLVRLLIQYAGAGLDIHSPAASLDEEGTDGEAPYNSGEEEEEEEEEPESAEGREQKEGGELQEEGEDTASEKGENLRHKGGRYSGYESLITGKPEEVKPGEDKGEGGEEQEKEKEAPPPLTGDTLTLDGISLSERYPRILPEAINFANKWRTDPVAAVPFIRTLLKQLALRHIPRFEDDCYALTEAVLAMDPACGIAARYAIDHAPLPPTSRRIVKLLTPVMTELTDDFETLAILAPALEKEGQNSLSRICLDLIESSTGDPLVTKRIEAEVRLAGGENEQALDLCREILAEGSERNDLLKDILPVLIRLNATGEIIEVVHLLTELGKFDEDTANSLIGYLEIASATELEINLAEMLLSEVDTPHRIVLTAVLARQFLKSKDPLRLAELGDRLLELNPGDVTNWADLHRALWAVGSALANLGEDEKAALLLEDQYFIRPDQAKPLRLLAQLHMNQGRVLKATEYLELYQLIHPNESATAVILARNWFFHLGEFEKAHKMMTDNRSFFQADPSMAMQILLGRTLLWGNLRKSLKDIERYRFRKGIKTPEVLFLTGTIYYLLEKNDAALRIFRLLNEEFEDNRFAALVEHLIERIADMPKELNSENSEN